jgi:hypothetical protein
MEDSAVSDFTVSTATDASGEHRLEIRLASNRDFVGWVRTHQRDSDGDQVLGVSIQLVRRKKLTVPQRAALETHICNLVTKFLTS